MRFKSTTTYNLSSNPFLYTEVKPQEFVYCHYDNYDVGGGGSVKSSIIPTFMSSFTISTNPDDTTPVPQSTKSYSNIGFIYVDSRLVSSKTTWYTEVFISGDVTYIKNSGLNDQTKIRYSVLIPKY